MATAKQHKPKPPVWAILDSERNVQLWVGREAPYLDGGFISAPRGTRFLGQLRGHDSKAATGFELAKVGKPVEITISVAPKSRQNDGMSWLMRFAIGIAVAFAVSIVLAVIIALVYVFFR